MPETRASVSKTRASVSKTWVAVPSTRTSVLETHAFSPKSQVAVLGAQAFVLDTPDDEQNYGNHKEISTNHHQKNAKISVRAAQKRNFQYINSFLSHT